MTLLSNGEMVVGNDFTKDMNPLLLMMMVSKSISDVEKTQK